jgi:hypothetical protein
MEEDDATKNCAQPRLNINLGSDPNAGATPLTLFYCRLIFSIALKGTEKGACVIPFTEYNSDTHPEAFFRASNGAAEGFENLLIEPKDR